MPFAEGQRFSLDVTVAASAIDAFAALSGDRNPLHMDAEFARSRGFAGRVAHGALLAAYVSQLIGMECPGRDAILHSMDLRFPRPVIAGDKVTIDAVIDHISEGTAALVLRVAVRNADSGLLHARGTVQVGVTAALR